MDPLFLSPTNLHLQGNSPIVSAGVAFAGIPTDFDDNTQPQGAGYEMGADEVKPATIVAAAGVTRQQGSPVTNSTIVTLANSRGEAGSSTRGGKRRRQRNRQWRDGIQYRDNDGNVTANVVASCAATNASFTLTSTLAA